MFSRKAVILFSGGLDTTTCLAIAKSQGFSLYTLTFDYGQRHQVELQTAQRIAKIFKVEEHRIMRLPLDEIGGSAITDKTIPVPDYQGDGKIPVTYVPARNTIFLAIALGWAETLGAQDIFIGVNATENSQYPDCSTEYIASFQSLVNVSTKAAVEGKKITIHAPLLHLTKAQTIELGLSLGVDYSLTVSCYQADAQGRACGRCDSCVLRKKGFSDLGITDPTLYN